MYMESKHAQKISTLSAVTVKSKVSVGYTRKFGQRSTWITCKLMEA